MNIIQSHDYYASAIELPRVIEVEDRDDLAAILVRCEWLPIPLVEEILDIADNRIYEYIEFARLVSMNAVLIKFVGADIHAVVGSDLMEVSEIIDGAPEIVAELTA